MTESYAADAYPIRLARDLRAAGYSGAELARLIQRTELVRVRRGAYAAASGSTLDERILHRQLVLATVALCSPEVVVSHSSAAALQNLPLWSEGLRRVHLTRDRAGRGARRRWVEIHGLRLSESEITEVEGVRLTTPARTVLDLACSGPLGRAVAAGDAALRQGTTRDELDDALRRAGSRHGIAAARRVVGLVDARSESPGESLSRVLFVEYGLPKPDLQVEVSDEAGNLLGRADFGWRDQRTLGEFDGRAKYGRLLASGRSPEEVVYAEKRREDALREQGWKVVRWSWADLDQPAALTARVRRVLQRPY